MPKMVKHTRSLSALQYACLLAYFAVLVFNALANTLPLGGRQTGEMGFSPPGAGGSGSGKSGCALCGLVPS
jgi:hypothetical protein